MRLIPGGSFLIGSDRHYPEEGPARSVEVDPFWIDVAPVTNAEFAAFVAETGHVTLAEHPPDPTDYPGIDPMMIRPGSLLFMSPPVGTHLQSVADWWSFAFDASWRQPYGPDSSIDGIGDHPVVHVAYQDAIAYARWAGKRLPTEIEWERAARGGLEDSDYAWGDLLEPEGAILANYWRGNFPFERFSKHERTSPIGTYPANAFGLYDMIGNVWEWTSDWWVDSHAPTVPGCCAPKRPQDDVERASRDPATPEIAIGRKVLKGGSHLCAANYCQRYRPAARYPQPIDTSTSHVGFRCVRDVGQ